MDDADHRIALGEKNRECDIERLMNEFIDSEDLIRAIMVYVTRARGPIQAKALDEYTGEIINLIQFKLSMMNLIEREDVVYLGDQKWCSDKKLKTRVLSALGKERERYEATLARQKE